MDPRPGRNKMLKEDKSLKNGLEERFKRGKEIALNCFSK